MLQIRRAFRPRIADHSIREKTGNEQLAAKRPKSQEVLERFMLGFPGRELSAELAELLAEGLAGVAIYARNFGDVAGLAGLTEAIRRAAGRPILIGIDQEGGTRFSLGEPFTPWPSPAELGRLGDTNLAEQMARAMARELRAAGVNLNFAPMLDLATNPNSPVTAGRSFGSDPARVAQMGCAFVGGFQAEGVLACAKHFPGHGDAESDPHLELPRFNGTRERLMSHELVPFSAAIKAGAAVIMTAHILIPRIDPAGPASLSRELLQSMLREQLGFDGIILADDLGMGAISRHYEIGEGVVKTLRAGADIAMLCHNWAAITPAIESVAQAMSATSSHATADNKIDRALATQSHARIERLRLRLRDIERLPRPPLEVIGCGEHRALAEEIHARISEVSA